MTRLTAVLRFHLAPQLLLVLALGIAEPVQAGTWVEVGDAGQTLDTKQVTTGMGALDTITGSVTDLDGATPDVADLYLITITDYAAFSASLDNAASTWDSELELFDAAGFGIYHQDDKPGASDSQAELPAGDPLGPQSNGTYLLAVQIADADAESISGDIFPAKPYSDVHGPTGPGGAGSLTGFDTSASPEADNLEPDTRTYQIDLTGAAFYAQVPEPASSVLLILGGLGMLVCRGRR